MSILRAVETVTIPDPLDWVGDQVGGVIGGGVASAASSVADALFSKVLQFITDLIATAVTKATELVISVFDSVTVKIGENGVLNGAVSAGLQLQMLALGAALLLLFFLIRIISALITQQMGKVARELFFDLPFTVIGTAAAGLIGVLILTLTDQMAAALSGGFADTLGTFAGQYFSGAALLDGGMFQMLFAVAYILAAIVVGIELVVRASLLTIIFVVAPVMIATRTWEGSRRYARRFIEVSLALMFAKPAAAMALAIGSAQLADGAVSDSGVQVMLGTTIVLLAAFMPFALFKLIPLVESAASVQQGIKGAPVRVAQTAAGFATAASLLRSSGASATPAAPRPQETSVGQNGPVVTPAAPTAPRSAQGPSTGPSAPPGPRGLRQMPPSKQKSADGEPGAGAP